MSVREITTKEELQGIIEEKDELIVVEFFAQWCGPCNVVIPMFEELADENKNVVFVCVDVDKAKPVSLLYDIQSMPTFVFIRTGLVLEKLSAGKFEIITERLKHYLA